MSAPYGELVVVLGDAHVGHRASDIPDKFKKMLAPDKMQYLVSTGNLCASETYEFCKAVAPRMYAVKGDMDDYSSSMTSAEEVVFEVGEFKIGVCHGHQVVPWGDRDALGLLARRLDVDILITGHTHECEAFEIEGTWFVNPGSVTGAYTPLRDEVRASFVLLSIQANTVKLYMYELNAVSGEVDIRRARFTKASKILFQSSISPFGSSTDRPASKSNKAETLPPLKNTEAPAIPKRPQQTDVKPDTTRAPPLPKRPQQPSATSTQATFDTSAPFDVPVKTVQSTEVVSMPEKTDSHQTNVMDENIFTTDIRNITADRSSAAPTSLIEKEAEEESKNKEDEFVEEALDANDGIQTTGGDERWDDV